MESYDNETPSDNEPTLDGRRRDRFGEDIDDRPGRAHRGQHDGGSPFWGMALTAQILLGTSVLAFVMPQFKDIFSGMKIELPLATQFILASSDFVVSWWFIIIPTIIGACAAVVGVAGNPRAGADGTSALVGANVIAFLLLVAGLLAVFMPMVKMVNAGP